MTPFAPIYPLRKTDHGVAVAYAAKGPVHREDGRYKGTQDRVDPPTAEQLMRETVTGCTCGACKANREAAARRPI